MAYNPFHTLQQTTQTNYGYNKDTDYQKLIDDAVAAQDYTRAAIYEAQRNEKIAATGAPYEPTYNYAGYLPGASQQENTPTPGTQPVTAPQENTPTAGAAPQGTAATFGYNPDTDYQALINQAAAAGDYARAAIYEAQRNEKIAATGAQYQPTYNYAGYLPGAAQQGNTQTAGAAPQGTAATFGYNPDTDYQALINQAAAAGDYARAAIYEAQRNEKIAATGAPYQPTYNYAGYLPGAQPQGTGQTAPGADQGTPVAGQTGGMPQSVEQVNLETSVMPGWENPYQAEIDAAIARVGDADAYKKLYLSEADRTMRDTLGQYAVMTGGSPSTQAVAAASQAADYIKSQLPAKIADLNLQQAQLLMNAGQNAQNIYQQQISAAMSRWSQLGYADEEVQATLGVPVGTPTSDQSYTNWSKAQTEQAYADEKNNTEKQKAYELAMNMIKMGITPDTATLILAGIPQSVVGAILGQNGQNNQQTGGGYGDSYGGSGTGSGYGNGMDGRAYGTLQAKIVALIGQGKYDEADALINNAAPEMNESQAVAMMALLNQARSANGG